MRKALRKIRLISLRNAFLDPLTSGRLASHHAKMEQQRIAARQDDVQDTQVLPSVAQTQHSMDVIDDLIDLCIDLIFLVGIAILAGNGICHTVLSCTRHLVERNKWKMTPEQIIEVIRRRLQEVDEARQKIDELEASDTHTPLATLNLKRYALTFSETLLNAILDEILEDDIEQKGKH